MNIQTEIAKLATSSARYLSISACLMESGNSRIPGLDVRKYNTIPGSSKFYPTPKGIFLTKKELTFLLEVLGFKFDDISNNDVKNLFASSQEVAMLGTRA